MTWLMITSSIRRHCQADKPQYFIIGELIYYLVSQFVVKCVTTSSNHDNFITVIQFSAL